MSVELPKDAEGREIPLDTTILYNEDGKCFKVNRFSYSVVQTMPGLKWGVVFMDCRYDYCSSFYLTPPEPPDSWEKLEEDLDSCSVSTQYAPCAYFSDSTGSCKKCPANPHEECLVQMVKHITLRIHKLRGEG